MNDKGEMFADFWAVCSMVIAGSVFPHKAVHKATREQQRIKLKAYAVEEDLRDLYYMSEQSEGLMQH